MDRSCNLSLLLSSLGYMLSTWALCYQTTSLFSSYSILSPSHYLLLFVVLLALLIMLILTGLKLTPLIFVICFLNIWHHCLLQFPTVFHHSVSIIMLIWTLGLEIFLPLSSTVLLSVSLFVFNHLLRNLLDGKIMLLDLRNVLVFCTKFGKRRAVLCWVFTFR